MAIERPRGSLKRHLVYWIALYVGALSVILLGAGMLVIESAERHVFEALLESELDRLHEHQIADSGYRWANTGALSLYVLDDPDEAPDTLHRLPPGVHDEIAYDGALHAVLIRDQDGKRMALSLNIDEFEKLETTMERRVLAGALLLVLLLGAGIVWGVNRALMPLSRLAGRIRDLDPNRHGERLELDAHAGAELAIIAEALNNYLQRNETFVTRELQFITTASHELRTPLTVITGASELALDPQADAGLIRHQLQRIRHVTGDMEQLITLLLALARNPDSLEKAGETIDLRQLLPSILDDHRHLACDKALTLVLDASAPCRIIAPPGIVRAAIGNLLRNAIENSDSGEIRLRLDTDAIITITDHGHGMTPEEISAIYSRQARAGHPAASGIGLDLITRLCEHLGWELDIRPNPPQGTIARLRLHGTIPPPNAV